MLYLGIDISKNNHVASLLDDNAKPPFPLPIQWMVVTV